MFEAAKSILFINGPRASGLSKHTSSASLLASCQWLISQTVSYFIDSERPVFLFFSRRPAILFSSVAKSSFQYRHSISFRI